MMARMDTIHRLSNMGSKAELAIAAAICPSAIDQNLHWVPNIAPSFRDGHLIASERTVIHLEWNQHIFWDGVFLSSLRGFTQYHSQGFTVWFTYGITRKTALY